MLVRLHKAVMAACLAAVLISPALAQQEAPQGQQEPPQTQQPQEPPQAEPDPRSPHGTWLEPPKKLPHVAGDRTRNLDFLFGALKAAPDAEIAKAIEHRIWSVWLVSRSDTTNLLMTRVRTALDKKDTDLALKLLDAIVKIKPDYVEAWNQRATLYYTRKD